MKDTGMCLKICDNFFFGEYGCYCLPIYGWLNTPWSHGPDDMPCQKMTSGVEWTLSQFKPVSPHLQFVLFVSDIVVINSNWFLGYFVGNTMWLIAISYYLYITFLGYNGKSCSRLNMLVVSHFLLGVDRYVVFRADTWLLVIKDMESQISCNCVTPRH